MQSRGNMIEVDDETLTVAHPVRITSNEQHGLWRKLPGITVAKGPEDDSYKLRIPLSILSNTTPTRGVRDH